MSVGGIGGITRIQELLNRSGAVKGQLKVDGEFGPVTRKALQRFQKQAGLKVTGDIDKATVLALGKSGGKPKRGGPAIVKGEITAIEPEFKAMRAQIAKARKIAADHDKMQKDLEKKLQSVGDEAQLANIDLQNILQKQQQTMQMMANVSKMLHDTAMAVIRKIG